MDMSSIVFDLGGVICRHQPDLRLRELVRIFGQPPEDVHGILYVSGFIGETELGYWNAEQIVSEIGARFGFVDLTEATSNDVPIATDPQKRRILDIPHATESGSGCAACARSPASPTTRSAVRPPSSEKPIHVRSS
jgi:hypothetical protein